MGTKLPFVHVSIGLKWNSHENVYSLPNLMNLYCKLSTIIIIHVDTWCTLLELFHVLFYQVKKDGATYSETPVEISGNDDAIKKAKELIEQIISPQSSVINSMGGTCYKFLKPLCYYIKLTLGESLLCMEQRTKKVVSHSPGASGFDVDIVTQTITVPHSCMGQLCYMFLLSGLVFCLGRSFSPRWSHLIQVFHNGFLPCCSWPAFFSSSLWYPDHNLGKWRNSLCGQSG